VRTTPAQKLLLSILLLIAVTHRTQAQENSPYSRYGLGDVMPNQPIASRTMGGIAAAFVDYDKRFDLKEVYPRSQTINFLNPASYARLRITSFDLGFEAGSRTLTQPTIAGKYKAASANIAYVQLGLPLSKKRHIGMNLGLRPITRINYKIERDERSVFASGQTDSIRNIFEGSGGSYEVFAGVGKAFKNFSVGVNIGYLFGTKDYSTRKAIINDSVPYYKSNYETKSSFGGIAINAGMQYVIDINKTTKIILGAYGNAQQKIKGNEDVIRETFDVSSTGVTKIDSVYIANSNDNIDYPTSYGIGCMIDKADSWMIGADFSATQWSRYKFFNTADQLQNSWMIKIGGQLTPNLLTAKNYWSRVTYRLGFNYGLDYIKINNTNLNVLTASTGLGLPVKTNRFSSQYTNINLGLEFGARGNSSNLLKENIFRVTLGFTLSDLWFVKRKYD
jgi:hypothetical protein